MSPSADRWHCQCWWRNSPWRHGGETWHFDNTSFATAVGDITTVHDQALVIPLITHRLAIYIVDIYWLHLSLFATFCLMAPALDANLTNFTDINCKVNLQRINKCPACSKNEMIYNVHVIWAYIICADTYHSGISSSAFADTMPYPKAHRNVGTKKRKMTHAKMSISG